MARKTCYEGDEVPLKVVITGGPAHKVTEVEFYLANDKKPLSSNPFTVPVDKATAPPSATLRHKPEDVGEKLDHYHLSYEVEVTPSGKSPVKLPGQDTVTVYPKTIKVAFTSDDGDAHKGVQFRIRQKGKLVGPYHAEEDGTWEGPGPLSDYSIEPDSPFDIVERIQDKGRSRSYKVKKVPYKAEFIAPKPDDPSKKISQFINMKPKRVGEWNKDLPVGHLLEFKVGAEGDTEKDGPDKAGKEGDIIFIEVDFVHNTKRNTPKPRLTRDNGEGHQELDGGKQFKGKLKLTADGTALFRVELGISGADQCTVKVNTTPAFTDDTFYKKLTFVNWRRAYYQVSRPSGIAKPVVAKFASGLRDSCVLAVEVTADAVVLNNEAGAPAGSWLDKGDLVKGAAGRALAVGSHNKAHFHGLFKDGRKPLSMHLFFCHFQIDGDGVPATVEQDGDSTTTIAWTDGTVVPGLEATGVAFGNNVFPKAVQDGNDSATATWTSNAVAGPHVGKSGAFPAGHIHTNYVDNTGDKGKVFVKFPPDALTVVNAGETIKVKIKAKTASGFYNGESDSANKHHLLIATCNPHARTADDMNGTMIHEVGHGLHMVADGGMVIPGIADPKAEHTRHYYRLGDHCATDVAAVDYAKPNPETWATSGTCVMFGWGHAGRKHKFCLHCKPLLLAVAMEDLSK